MNGIRQSFEASGIDSKPNQSKAQKYKRSVDCRYFFGAELSQICGGDTLVYDGQVGGEFFSMGEGR